MADLKPRPNHAEYLRALRAMSPQARLRRAFELSDLSVALFRAGMARRFPDLSPAELNRRVGERLDRCQQELLKLVIARLYEAGIEYMLTRSLASSLQGEPRATHDIDPVVAIRGVAGEIVGRFREDVRGPEILSR